MICLDIFNMSPSHGRTRIINVVQSDPGISPLTLMT